MSGASSHNSGSDQSLTEVWTNVHKLNRENATQTSEIRSMREDF